MDARVYTSTTCGLVRRCECSSGTDPDPDTGRRLDRHRCAVVAVGCRRRAGLRRRARSALRTGDRRHQVERWPHLRQLAVDHRRLRETCPATSPRARSPLLVVTDHVDQDVGDTVGQHEERRVRPTSCHRGCCDGLTSRPVDAARSGPRPLRPRSKKSCGGRSTTVEECR